MLGVSELLVIGSQAVLGSIDQPFPEAERSIEVDVAVLDDDDGTKADLIDGSIGELSMFQETFGYYAQGVIPSTAVLPDNWRNRLVRYESSGTGGVVALCLELHDLWLSKAAAFRDKDVLFCLAMLDRDLVDAALLRERLRTMTVAAARRQQIEALIGGIPRG